MKPIKFPQENMVLEPPPDMANCDPLHVHRSPRHFAFISCWEPTWRERLAIFLGRPVWVWVMGDRHPPIAVDVETPFAETTDDE